MLLVDGPALCEAPVDPFEAPIPARVTVRQALHMAEALAKGQPNRVDVSCMKQSRRLPHGFFSRMLISPARLSLRA